MSKEKALQIGLNIAVLLNPENCFLQGFPCFPVPAGLEHRAGRSTPSAHLSLEGYPQSAGLTDPRRGIH